MNVKDKNILVTGGTGFIGEHLVNALLVEGANVSIFSKKKKTTPDIEFFEGDVRKLSDVNSAMQDKDIIIHLACSPAELSVEHLILDFEVNALGTLNALNAAKENNVERFVYTSSAEVYGVSEYIPIDEKHPTKPINPYGASKLAAEIYTNTFFRTYGMKTNVLRFFNVYGPGLFPRRTADVVTLFVKRVLSGKPPILKGDLENARDFVYIEDVVKSIILSLKKDSAVGETINIGSGKATTINELATLVILLVGKKNITPVHKEGQSFSICADITKARKILNYTPSISMKGGVEKTLTWGKHKMKGGD